jgi:glucokinase
MGFSDGCTGPYATNENVTIDEDFMTLNAEGSVLVYDVGGSHIAAAVCHAGHYGLSPVVSTPHPAEETSEAFVRALHELGVKASAGLAPVAGAELAFPGPFDYATGVSWMKHKLPFLYGLDLRGELAARFGWQPAQVRFLKDSDAFLLGEIGGGAARGVARAVGITLGTGIGSAFAVDGRVVSDGAGVPPGGEIWNLPYEGGIIEDSVSTRGIRAAYERRTGVASQVVDLAKAAATDPAAAEAFAEFGHHLGRALHGALAAFAAQVIVLGGGISRSPHLFLPAAQRELDGLNAEFRVSALLDDAPLVGAGVAWFSGVNAASRQAIADDAQITAN